MKYVQAVNDQHIGKSGNDVQHEIQHAGPPHTVLEPLCVIIWCVVRERSAILNQPVGTEK